MNSQSILSFLYVILGGALGAGTRYLFSKGLEAISPFTVPLILLLINVLGSFALGYIFFLNTSMPAHIKAGLTIGFLGAFTTFSSYALEAIRLLQTNAIATTLLYIILHNILALCAVTLGMWIASISK